MTRTIKYLSPSSLGLFEENRSEWYLKYLCENRPPRIPQTQPMSVGSSFDAYCKSELHALAYGAGADPTYSFEALFETQVESHNRDWALGAGAYVFECYKKTGAMDDLKALLEGSASPPQFEFQLDGTIDGVPLLGRPDCRFIHRDGAHIVFDWKVCGFCSRSPVSPCKHYVMCRDSWTEGKPTRGAGTPHREYFPLEHKGLTINKAWFEVSNKDWADQLSTYAWMLGEAVGDEEVVMAVDQVCAKPSQPLPLLRVAQFRSRASRQHQLMLLQRYKSAWGAIQDDHIFTDMDLDESRAQCKLLDEQAIAMSDDSDFGRYLNEICRNG